MIKYYLALMIMLSIAHDKIIYANASSLIQQCIYNEAKEFTWEASTIIALHSIYPTFIDIVLFRSFIKNATICCYIINSFTPQKNLSDNLRTLILDYKPSCLTLSLQLFALLQNYKLVQHGVKLSNKVNLIVLINKKQKYSNKKAIAQQIGWLTINTIFPYLVVTIKNIIDNKVFAINKNQEELAVQNNILINFLAPLSGISENFRKIMLYNQTLSKCAQSTREHS